MSPEYGLKGNFSEKSDAYSFGVIVLEIVSGRKNSDLFNSEEWYMNLVAYVSHFCIYILWDIYLNFANEF